MSFDKLARCGFSKLGFGMDCELWPHRGSWGMTAGWHLR